MNITNELLAAYAVGNVTNDERNSVRQYLADNPRDLETVMVMMDEDYDIDLEDGTDVEDTALTNENPFPDICYSAAAFAPQTVPAKKNVESPGHIYNGGFNRRLDDLLDEISL